MIRRAWDRLRGRHSGWRRLRDRLPDFRTASRWSARFGFGARGFVYLSVGAVMLLGAFDLVGRPVSTMGLMPMLLHQPLGRVWVAAVGSGLWAFAFWRLLQSVFDADREGRSREALSLRFSQLTSALVYTGLGAAAFATLATSHTDSGHDLVENRQRADWLLDLPLGGAALMAVGAGVLWIGGLNIWRAINEDFVEALECSPELCRRVTPLARIGHVARGLSYMPLGALVILAGWRDRASDVPSFGSALASLRELPGGAILLGLTALGLLAFGAFSMIEARFRRIRPPKDLSV